MVCCVEEEGSPGRRVKTFVDMVMSASAPETKPIPATEPPPVAVPVVQIQVHSDGAQGHWKTELCGCCEECNSCCAAFWCPCITTAQLATKMSIAKLSCSTIATMLFVVSIVGYFLHYIGSELLGHWYCASENLASGECNLWLYQPNHIVAVAGQVLLVIFGVCMIVYTCQARAVVRKHSGIPGEDCCAGASCEDCCCSFWCQCCVTTQIFRHLGIGSKAKGYATEYSLCSNTGEHNPTLLSR